MILSKEELPFLFMGNKKPLYYIAYLSSLSTLIFALYNIQLGNTMLCLPLFLFSVMSFFETIIFQKKGYLIVNVYLLVASLLLAYIVAIIELGVVAAYWIFPFAIAQTFILPRKIYLFYNCILFIFIISYSLLNVDIAITVRLSFSLGLTMVFSYLVSSHIQKLHKDLIYKSIRDPMTGAFNRSQLTSNLQKALADKKRNNVGSTILMIDIDNFKMINDKHGHDIGDLVIKRIVKIIKSSGREIDLLFRIGGEEFILLMHNIGIENSKKFAETLRQNIQSESIVLDQNVTVSIGVCAAMAEFDSELWMKYADNALYQAKKNGRNQVVLFKWCK